MSKVLKFLTSCLNRLLPSPTHVYKAKHHTQWHTIFEQFWGMKALKGYDKIISPAAGHFFYLCVCMHVCCLGSQKSEALNTIICQRHLLFKNRCQSHTGVDIID